jgi:hypothetical protein
MNPIAGIRSLRVGCAEQVSANSIQYSQSRGELTQAIGGLSGGSAAGFVNSFGSPTEECRGEARTERGGQTPSVALSLLPVPLR